MSPNPDLEEEFKHYYSASVTRAAERLEQAALGHAVGVGGYTTVGQADELLSCLHLDPTGLLLDLGAGRGWPGVYIAQRSGCHLIALDIPFEAMQRAHATMQPVRPGRTCAAVVADGRAQPFVPAAFDAIVHADSF
jgi:cyclopropane fatty-acyl-phospholipid synthase-like methyltransferase